MIFDHRTYELQPGRLREFLALYEHEGLPVRGEACPLAGRLLYHVNNKILVPTSLSPTK